MLFHGFPSSSHIYRDLIAELADDYHLIAPDYPGFGNSDMPSREAYQYTFDNISVTMEKFIDEVGLRNFALYMQDYGAPIGYRIILRRAEFIKALLIQNANAYVEGLGPATQDGQILWANRNEETERPLRNMLGLEGTKTQYLDGVGNPEKVSPDTYHYDQYFLNRPGNADIQIDLLYDYRNNLLQYPAW